MAQSFLMPEQVRREHRARLSARSFGTIRTVDWDALDRAHLREEVESLLLVGGWLSLLTVTEPAYRDVTLEFLSTFVRHGLTWDDPYALIFQLWGQQYHLSYTEFTVFMGLYSSSFTQSEAYRALQSSPDYHIPASAPRVNKR